MLCPPSQTAKNHIDPTWLLFIPSVLFLAWSGSSVHTPKSSSSHQHIQPLSYSLSTTADHGCPDATSSRVALVPHSPVPLPHHKHAHPTASLQSCPSSSSSKRLPQRSGGFLDDCSRILILLARLPPTLPFHLANPTTTPPTPSPPPLSARPTTALLTFGQILCPPQVYHNVSSHKQALSSRLTTPPRPPRALARRHTQTSPLTATEAVTRLVHLCIQRGASHHYDTLTEPS